MRFDSIRFKASVLYTIILAVILSIFGGVIFYASRIILYRDLDERLTIKAEEVGDIIHTYEQAERAENHPLNFLPELFGDERIVTHKRIIDDLWYSEVKTLNLKNDYVHILTSKGRLLLASENVKEKEERLFTEQFPFATNRVIFKDLKNKNQHLRAINFPLYINNHLKLIVQIATPLSDVIRILDKLMIFIILAVISILILTSFLGSAFAQSILMPVKKIAETANGISHKQLNVQVEENQPDEEIRYLVKSFNTMLSRLEESFSHINEFSSHVAHELKTPLAILRGEMELALSEKYSVEELRKVLETGMEEVNRVIKIVKDLLLLANLDYRTDIFKFEKINLAEFIKEIYENGKILAKEKNIEMTSEIFPSELYINGDKVHLRRLFFNLIHNAVKFTPSGGKISIVFKVQDKSAVISVADTGIGIAQEDLSKIFKKFFRVGHKSPKSSETGNGLGLSIAQSIAEAHQGVISAQSEVGKGSVFTVSLPPI